MTNKLFIDVPPVIFSINYVSITYNITIPISQLGFILFLKTVFLNNFDKTKKLRIFLSFLFYACMYFSGLLLRYQRWPFFHQTGCTTIHI
ncbi:hypothetical protein COL23_03745 [Priestia aryabhattai]|nr:hypothetical protein COL23_03745 [Priestia aryabhattai]